MKNNRNWTIRPTVCFEDQTQVVNCIIDKNDGNATVADDIYNDQDARLIASAPDMLKTLKAIVALIDGEWDNPNLVDMGGIEVDSQTNIVKRYAKEAILKAEGR